MFRMARDERGVALVSALIALVIVSMLGAAALTLAEGTINQTVWDRASGQAFHVAEAGFDQAVARIKAGTGTPGTYTAKLASGEASVSIQQLTSFAYIVKSVGAQPTLAEPKARRAVQGVVTYIDPATVFYADAAQGTVLGSTTFDGPLFVRDRLFASGNAVFNIGPFFVKDDPATLSPTGDLDLGGSGTMGTADQPVYLFVDGLQPYNPAGTRLYAEAVYTDVPDLTMPVVDDAAMPARRAAAGADGTIDNDAITNGARPELAFNKNTPDTTYGVYPTGPYLIWKKATTTLNIKGQIYVDGPLAIGGTGVNKINSVTYEGRGTITAYGNITLYCAFAPNPAPPAVGTPFPNTSAFGLVTPKTVNMDAQTGDTIAAVIYAYNKMIMKKQMDFYGNVTSRLLDFDNNPHVHVELQLNLSNLPPGMPVGAPWTGVSGWQEVQP